MCVERECEWVERMSGGERECEWGERMSWERERV